MKSSLIISFDEDIDSRGGNFYNITVNGQSRYKHYTDIINLYSTYIVTGDSVTISTSLPINFYVYRVNYTADDQDGDKGIKTELITSSTNTTSITFIISTTQFNYNYEYRVDVVYVSDFQIWTEASEPILTENNEYINQQH